MRRAVPLTGALLALSASIAHAATFKVGSDGASCTHTTLQAAINAAEANPGPDFIVATRSGNYAQSALVINTNQPLTILGGYANCITNFSDGTYTVIDGAGGSSASTMRIVTGSAGVVSLNYLIVRNGDPNFLTGAGGNINFDGAGVLSISDAAIINGRAVKGGGIYANGSGAARLVLGANVGVNGNTARGDGGGVFVNGMLFEMSEAGSVIAFNKALGEVGTGYGGGLVIRSDGDRAALGLVSSGGIGATGAIYSNEAKRGGGVAVSAGSGASSEAGLVLFSTEPDKPGAIRENFASERGGAIYVWPAQDQFDTGFAYATLQRAELTGNAAPEGAAVYLDSSNAAGVNPVGGTLYFNLPGTAPPNALPCPVNATCGLVRDNVADDASGAQADGALVYASASDVNVRRVLVTANRTGRLFDLRQSEDNSSVLAVLDSAIVANTFGQELVRATGDSSVTFADSTVAGNTIGGSTLITASRDDVGLRRSILWQPGKLTLVPGGGAPVVQQVIASENATIGGAPNAIVQPPRFLDPARGDYRLRAASPAVDFAPAVAGDDRDALNLPRDQRLGFLPRSETQVRDLGAYERQALQPFVLNGEFEGDMNLWFLPPGHDSTYSNDNAPGSPAGSGSVFVTGQGAAQRFLGLAQCINVPGPGTYNLRGWGHSIGSATQWNRTAIIWELRDDGGEGCIDGPISAGGEVTLATTDQWTASPLPATITVPEGAWNLQTSITVILAVYPNASNDQFNGWFDRIVLAPGSGAELFKDGFE